MDEYFIDEDNLAIFWNQNRHKLNGNFPLKDFLVWAQEWVDTCEKIRRILEMRKGSAKR